MAGAGYKTFLAGDVFTDVEAQTYFMDQVVTIFADTTARDAAITSPTEGQVSYSQADNAYYVYSGTAWIPHDIAWVAWTPTLTNLTQGTGATLSAFYSRIGKTVVAQVYITMGTSPTVGGQFSISLPIDIANGNRSVSIGTCVMRDAGASVSYLGSVTSLGSGPSVARMQTIGTAGATATLSSQTATSPFTWATTAGSYFQFTIMYQGV
jgi:hypothetical protein